MSKQAGPESQTMLVVGGGITGITATVEVTARSARGFTDRTSGA